MEASRLAAAIGREYQPPHKRTPTIKQIGDSYIVDFSSDSVTVEVSRMESSRSETHGVIRVLSSLPGTPPMLHQGRFNLTSTAARQSLVKYLQTREGQTDWAEVIEQVCFRVLEAMREGQPTVRLDQVPVREGARYRISPLIIEGFPNIIFGPGGSGKSQLAATLAMLVHGTDGKGWDVEGLKFDAIPGPVLVCDWELDDVTYREMCEPIARGFGASSVPNLFYRQCLSPLAEEAASIARVIDKEGIEMIVIDSLGYAIGGDKASQELTMKMFSAIRSWKRTVLAVDHVTNDENAGNRPYGSVYTVNSARSLWRVRAAQEEGSNVLSIGLFQTKANFGKQPPVGFALTFEDGLVSVVRQDVRDVVETFIDVQPAKVRIKSALLNAKEALNEEQIAVATGLDKASVKARLAELRKAGEVVRLDPPQGTNFATRWALSSPRQEPD